ncbi:hypothetical protein IMZ38_01380 [Thermosphaera chiliense]|uniref:DUF131 domain-containing protein n=1 Tax=Thermosphaera chiliense TaxID=3402707 RepID=A0A7M1USS5_9CREN|nr:hypothetical protein [Thermosphaera aggregans]QOR94617.1 hypothetical protein IMZ38_01380 [Thermosphaera aggregans]
MSPGRIGLILIALGFAVVLAAAALWTGSGGGEAGFAGCVIIFFIPLCWGVGSPGIISILLLALIVILAVAVLLNIFLATSVLKQLRKQSRDEEAWED